MRNRRKTIDKDYTGGAYKRIESTKGCWTTSRFEFLLLKTIEEN